MHGNLLARTFTILRTGASVSGTTFLLRLNVDKAAIPNINYYENISFKWKI